MDMLFDSKTAGDVKVEEFEQSFKQMCPGRKPEAGIYLQLCEFLPEPRLMKTHLPLCLMPPDLLDKAKVSSY